MPEHYWKGLGMIPLLDLQNAMRRGLLGPDDGMALAHIVADGIAAEARLNIYRNGVIGALTKALRLSFPAVDRLVGSAFFESASRIFIESEPPHCAWLGAYGSDFPRFLGQFAPAATLPYLPEVARLEWVVSQAVHAPDAAPLNTTALSAVDPALQGRIAFVPHPSIGLVEAEYPVDAIWRAVLDGDDAAMSALDLSSGPVRLLIQRGPNGIVVIRCERTAWRFAQDLMTGCPLESAFLGMQETEATILLAAHLAAGRFSGFTVTQETKAGTE